MLSQRDCKGQYHVCFFDYYAAVPGVQAALRDLLNGSVPRDGGRIDWDVAGTLQGFWHVRDANYGNLRFEDYGLAVVHDTVSARGLAVSVGLGAVVDSQVYYVMDAAVTDWTAQTTCTFPTDKGVTLILTLVDPTTLTLAHAAAPAATTMYVR